MPAVIDLHDKRRGFKVPESLRDDAYQYVQNQNTGENRHPEFAPFPRLVDFWFAGVVSAVAHSLEPDPDIPTVTPNYFGPDVRRHIRLADWQVDLLVAIALSRQPDLSPQVANVSPETVLDTANALAVVGMKRLYDDLAEMKLDSEETPLTHLMGLYKKAVPQAT